MFPTATLLVSALLLLSSMLSAFVGGRYRLALCLLLLAVCPLGYAFITMDPFLHPWDERIHAIVAQNLAEHPLRPTLIDKPYLPYDYKDWGFNHIWLHKQPFFLWLMAASIRLFGPEVWAVRLPSVLCILAMILMIYDACCKLDPLQGKRWGYWSALLLSSNAILWNIASGLMCMDANDMVFMTTVLGSFWCWIRLEKSGKYVWAAGMGIFVAAAILTKWLTGCLVLEAWFCYHLLRRDLWHKTVLSRISLGVLVTAVLAGSWIYYCRLHYGRELDLELSYNHRHFWEAIEFHEEPLFFYFNKLPKDYSAVWLLLIPACIMAWHKRKTLPELAILFLSVLTVYVFFTIAATKMEGYVLMCMPLMCMVMAFPLSFLQPKQTRHKVLTVLLACGIWLLHFNPQLTQDKHFPKNGSLEYGKLRTDEIRQQAMYRNLNPAALDSVDCIIYAKEQLTLMFYTGKTAYGDWVYPRWVDSLQQSGLRLGYIEGEAKEGSYGLEKMKCIKPLMPASIQP
jgi:4-amino-4-deoxy-L-arabinose transferase